MTKNAYWTLVDEHKDTQIVIETLTYEATVPGGKLVRTVTWNTEMHTESMVFVPVPVG